MICFKTLHQISTSQPLHFTGPFNVKLDHESSSHLTVNHKSSNTVTIRTTRLSIKIEQNRNRDFSLKIESKSIVWLKSHIVTALVDLYKLWHDVQNEGTLICAKFGKDLFNISTVIGRKKVTQFFDSQCIYTVRHKELHPSYWYNNFAKLCHTVMIFGIQMHMRISYCLPV